MTFYEEFNVKLKRWKQRIFCRDEVLSITHDGLMRCNLSYSQEFVECKRQACSEWCYWKDRWL